MYLLRNHGFVFSDSRNALSTLLIKIHTYGEANLSSYDCTRIFFLIHELNSKYLFFNTNLAILTKYSIGTVFLKSDLPPKKIIFTSFHTYLKVMI